MRLSENTIGALLMMASMAAYTLNDTLMKSLSGHVPLFQVIFLRGCLTSAAVAVIAWRMGAFSKRVSRRDTGAIALRVLGEVAGTYFFLTALYHMPLANVTSILQALPLAITLTAALVFREKIGLPRLGAITVGFIGVMLIVRPGAEGFNLYALYGLAAVGCLTVRDLATRSLSRETSSMLVTFATSVTVMAAFGLAQLGGEWAPLDRTDIAKIGGAAALIVAGYLTSIMVVRVGDIGFTAPFRYTAILWALVLGWLAFGDWPAPIVLVGAGIVVASGLFTLYREARLGRKRRPVPVLRPR
ncbi:EamA family transporter [Pelagivirga sediminicola]|uniref:EamA family transporter n=1 Tax=Pelagivirga sediminicola TaxID=2170575 RepID=A0A2T7G9X5_9RHOB|nr:DMT family transporter [Pelagivirga sediminicola]PVA11222.1 EamA family transporter [Pelagivirga sediminicola]